MMFEKKLERARQVQREQRGLDQKEQTEDYNGEKLYEPSIHEEMEKGDMFALMVSGVLTILPVAALALLLVIGLACLLLGVF
jgi:hypothetical protein